MIVTDIDFPSELPDFRREGFSLKYEDEIQRTGMASGRARQRRTFEKVPIIANVSIELNDYQAQLFERWYAKDLKAVNWFNLHIRLPSSSKTVARFTKKFTGPTLLGMLWVYSFELEIFEQEFVDGDYLSIVPQFVKYSSIFDLAVNKEWPGV